MQPYLKSIRPGLDLLLAKYNQGLDETHFVSTPQYSLELLAIEMENVHSKSGLFMCRMSRANIFFGLPKHLK